MNKKDRKIERYKPQGKNIMSASATHGGHNYYCVNWLHLYASARSFR